MGIRRIAAAAIVGVLLTHLVPAANADAPSLWEPLVPMGDYNATWEPCATVTYGTNLRPTSGLSPRRAAAQRASQKRTVGALRWAMARVTRQTGVRFVPAAVGTKAALAITYRRTEQDAQFRPPNAALAYAGPKAYTEPEGGRVWIAGAIMVVDRVQMLPMSRKDQQAFYLHELGHVVGLGHTADPNQVMNPICGGFNLQTGDLLGLHTLYPDYRTC